MRPATMNLQPNQQVQVEGSLLSAGDCIIHFYYSQSERLRFVGFVADGVSAGDGVVLACTGSGYDSLQGALKEWGMPANQPALAKVEVTDDLDSTIGSIVDAVEHVRHGRRRARVFADFSLAFPVDRIFEIEAMMDAALAGREAIWLTQYDGAAFAARVALEQFRTHTLSIIGNVFYQENKSYTPAEIYFKARAATGRA